MFHLILSFHLRYLKTLPLLLTKGSYKREESIIMKKIHVGLLMIILVAIAVCVIILKGYHEEEPRKCVRLPRESVYLGSVSLSDGEVRLLGAETKNGKQIKIIDEIYVVGLDEHFLTIEIYSQDKKSLVEKKMYKIWELKHKYPLGFFIWVEQNEAPTVIFIPYL